MKFLKSVHELYISPEFRGLRLQLMNERTDGGGVLRCEYCKGAILKSCDCIAHHVKPVTSANLNNVEITLNPANIQLVHHKCHNAIHERFGYNVRKIFYVYGAPCSGKNSWVNANKDRDDIIIDIDNIWQSLTGKRYFKPNALKPVVFDIYNFELSKVKENRGFWKNAFIIEGGANKVKRNERLRSIGAEPVFIDSTIEQCFSNLEKDKDRQPFIEEWQEYIKQWFDNYEP